MSLDFAMRRHQLARSGDRLAPEKDNDDCRRITELEGQIAELKGRVARIEQARIKEPVPAPAPAPAPQRPPQRITMELIKSLVAKRFEVSPDDLISKCRTTECARPRLIVYFLAREHTNLSFAEIGRRLGGRDHTSALSGEQRVLKRSREDPDFAYDVAELDAELMAMKAGS